MKNQRTRSPARLTDRQSPSRVLGWHLALGMLSLVAGPVPAQVQFTDVSAAAGVDGDLYASPTRHSLGVNWIDFDADGWPDLFLVSGDPLVPPHLFRNQRDGTFTREDDLLPALPQVEMSGSVFADYDGDGDDDIFVYTDNTDFDVMGLNLPDGPLNLLLKNLWVENGRAVVEGQPLFEEVAAAAGLDDAADPPLGDLPGHRTKTAGWVDYDRDGCVDLYVGHWVMNVGGAEGNRDRLYRNRCDGTFEDVTASSGVNPGTDPTTYRAALAFLAAHLDGDLWPDLYVVNMSEVDPQPYINDFIYRNNGAQEGSQVTFTEVSGSMPGVGDDNAAGMGIDVADLDLDGDWDIYISDLFLQRPSEASAGNVLYLGNGDGTFADNSAVDAGVDEHNSWGVNFFDADHDGYEDLYVATLGTAERELPYLNNGDGTFTNAAAAAGLVTYDTRGSAVADYDRDGDLDLAVVNQHRTDVAGFPGVLQLFRNDTVGAGNWLQVELVGLASNRDAIGAVVEVTAGGVLRMRQIEGGSSAHSQDALGAHFGLGDATVVDELRVRWPSGQENVLTDLAVNRFLTVIEGQVELFWDGFESGDTSAWQ